jgi:hypothetical protein
MLFISFHRVPSDEKHFRLLAVTVERQESCGEVESSEFFSRTGGREKHFSSRPRAGAQRERGADTLQ